MGANEVNRVSRRSFIGGMSGLAAGCASVMASGGNFAVAEESAQASEWDAEYDYVSVGGGSAMLGALRAKLNGDSVAIIEKMPYVGGNSAYASGDVWIGNNGLGKAEGDSREKVIEYLKAIQDGSEVEDAVLEAYADGMPEMLAFFTENTGLVPVARPFGDYYLDRPGSYFEGRTTAFKKDGSEETETGAGLVEAMRSACEAAGVEFWLESPVVELVSRKQESGVPEVLGVVCDCAGEKKRIKARKAVMIAAGGFEWNDHMKSCFLRGPVPYSCGSSANTGDLILLAMELGCDLWQMNEVWHMPVYKELAERNKAEGIPATQLFYERHLPHTMIVNRYGERFMNESMDYDRLYRSFFTFNNFGSEGGDFGYRNLPAWMILDSQYIESNYPLVVAHYGAEAATEIPDFFVKADTIEELAAAIGVDPDGLASTVEKFNGYCADGVDLDFNRDGEEFNRLWAGVAVEGVEQSLGTIEKPPFYAAEVSTGDIGTCGGVRVDEHSRAIHRSGEPIGRLYACGNTSGLGGPGPLYTGGGGTVSQPMTFSIIAADHAHNLEPWE